MLKEAENPASQMKTDPEENPPYRVEPEGGRFKVVDGEGKAMITCGTGANADQYAALLNQSFRRGYKAGFRDAKQPDC